MEVVKCEKVFNPITFQSVRQSNERIMEFIHQQMVKEITNEILSSEVVKMTRTEGLHFDEVVFKVEFVICSVEEIAELKHKIKFYEEVTGLKQNEI